MSKSTLQVVLTNQSKCISLISKLPYITIFYSLCANGTFNCVDVEGSCDVEESCPNNLMFSYFANQCPITCQNIHLVEGGTTGCFVDPQPGCVCQEGYVLDVSCLR